MNCIEIKNLLFPFFEGNLEEEKKILVEKHLSECKRCYLEYELIVSIENTLKTAEKAEAPDFLRERILSKIYPAFEYKREKLELGILS
ncbi:MAG: zf-HC2 domain-containing protein, partial [Candidatus Helarchaeota archaeon]|nr:zf-HC2 domain-containing protein [Candidatus Helarchaeota archaeon]